MDSVGIKQVGTIGNHYVEDACATSAQRALVLLDLTHITVVVVVVALACPTATTLTGTADTTTAEGIKPMEGFSSPESQP